MTCDQMKWIVTYVINLYFSVQNSENGSEITSV